MRAIDHPLGLTDTRLADMAVLSPFEIVVVFGDINRRREALRNRERYATDGAFIRVRKRPSPPTHGPPCECGCGELVQTCTSGGVWSRWRVGHHLRGVGGYRGEITQIA